MSKQSFSESELILNEDGSTYHLMLQPHHIQNTVILVGDPGRVSMISRRFDNVHTKITNREFVTHVGEFKGLPITVLSTGIGSDNIDIVMNELDALVNINLDTRESNDQKRSLDIVRIGTSGALQPEIPTGTLLVSEYGLGLDGLIHYYDHSLSMEETALTEKVSEHLGLPGGLPKPYVVKADQVLLERIAGTDLMKGITVTATGFYGPQGRQLRANLANPWINDRLQSFDHHGHKITNYEMETSALYGLGKILGHRCCTCCAILANRKIGEYAGNHQNIMDNLIETVLKRLSA